MVAETEPPIVFDAKVLYNVAIVHLLPSGLHLGIIGRQRH